MEKKLLQLLFFRNPFLPWDELDEGGELDVDQVDEEEFDRIQAMYDDNIDVVEGSQTVLDFVAQKPNQFSCVAHRLQLVLKDVFEKDEQMVSLRKVETLLFFSIFWICFF